MTQIEPRVTGSYTQITPTLSGPAIHDNAKLQAINILPAASNASKAELRINPMGFAATGGIYRVRPCWEPSVAGGATAVGTMRLYDRAGQAFFIESPINFNQNQVLYDPAAPVAGVPEIWFQQAAGSDVALEIYRSDSAVSSYRMWLHGMYVDQPAQPTLPAGRSWSEANQTLYAGTAVRDLRENLTWKMTNNADDVGMSMATMMNQGAGSYRFRPAYRFDASAPANGYIADIREFDGGSSVRTANVYTNRDAASYTYPYGRRESWADAAGYWPNLERLWMGSENISARVFRFGRRNYNSWFAGWFVDRQDPYLYDAAVNGGSFGGYNYQHSQWIGGEYRQLWPSDYAYYSMGVTSPIEVNVNFTSRMAQWGWGAGQYRIWPWMVIDSQALNGTQIYVCRGDVYDSTRGDQTLNYGSNSGNEMYYQANEIPTTWIGKGGSKSYTFNWNGSQGIVFRILVPSYDWNGTWNPGYYWLHARWVYVRGFWIDKIS